MQTSNKDLPMEIFDHLAGVPGVVHGVFSRQGGVSPAPWDQLNLGMNTGDDVDRVTENRRRLLARLADGAPGLNRAFFVNQVHGDDVLVLRQGNRELEDFWAPGRQRPGHQADAMVTDEPHLALVIQVADCQAVLLADPVNRVVAAVHSGWRGSVSNIIGKTVATMAKCFQCQPENILAGVGPSLGPCCAEFIHYRDEIPPSLWKYKDKEKDYFDFWALSRDQLAQAGVLKKNMGFSHCCTRCKSSQYFSYRKQQVTGRFGAAISLV